MDTGHRARQIVGDLAIRAPLTLWVPLSEIAGRLNVDGATIGAAAALAEANGWIEIHGGEVMLTERGRRLTTDGS